VCLEFAQLESPENGEDHQGFSWETEWKEDE